MLLRVRDELLRGLIPGEEWVVDDFSENLWFWFAICAFSSSFVSFCRAHVLLELLPVWMRVTVHTIRISHATPFRETCWPAACYPENTEQIQDSASNALNRFPASGEVPWMVSKCAGSGAEQRDDDCYNIEVIGTDKKINFSIIVARA